MSTFIMFLKWIICHALFLWNYYITILINVGLKTRKLRQHKKHYCQNWALPHFTNERTKQFLNEQRSFNYYKSLKKAHAYYVQFTIQKTPTRSLVGNNRTFRNPINKFCSNMTQMLQINTCKVIMQYFIAYLIQAHCFCREERPL